ncbi:Sushi domain protein [Aphelenchoides bicaudatus]|nr:Sushi domain protein [Aphelenchoides bicaudatus]
MRFDLLRLIIVCVYLSSNYAKADNEHCARFSERSDGDVSYDPDEEIGLQLGSVATLQCHNGNIRRSRCTANGWKPPTFNRCQQVVRDEPNGLNAFGSQSSCPPIPATNVSNGFIVYGTLAPPYSTATLVCNLGFLPNGKTSARCDPSGTWTELGICEPSSFQHCMPIGDVPNGQVSYSGGKNGQAGIGSVAELNCKLGFSAVGNNRVTCAQSGWEPSPGIGQCIEREIKRVKRQQLGIDSIGGQCTPINTLNGQISYLQTRRETCCASGSTAILTCSPGFNPVGSTSAYCSGSLWSPSIGTCQQFGSSLGLGGVPTVGGIGFPGTNNGGIAGATCPALPVATNGQITYSMGGIIGPFPSGSTATLFCNPGFSINSGVASASCQNGIWTPPTLGQCVSSALNPNGLGLGAIGSGCPAALVPANGQLQYSSGPGLGTYPEGSTSSLICNAGFQMSGPSLSTCRSGQWYPQPGLCVSSNTALGLGGINGLGTSASVCAIGMSPPIGGGTVQYSTGTAIGPWQTGSTATLICPLGSTSISSTASCQYGQWSPPVFQPCSGSGNALGGGIGNFGTGIGTGSQCTLGLNPILGGTIQYSNNQLLPPFPSGTSASVRCNSGGFPSSGTSTSTCQNGVWNPPTLSSICGTSGFPSFIGENNSQQQQCMIGILPPANGKITYSQNDTSATLTCDPGFSASGILNSYCRSSRWEPSTLGACLSTSSGVFNMNTLNTFGSATSKPL